MTEILSTSEIAINKAASILRDGGIVAMPTETVYGLAANALDGRAVARVFAAKGRPSFNPLIVHVYDLAQAQDLADFTEHDLKLADAFWPGALTLILPRKSNSGLSDLVTAGLDSVAVRCPAHKTARALIKACGFPVAAPSANKSGSLSPTAPAHVVESLGSAVDMILADGACSIGIESTVVDCRVGAPVILRSGIVSAEDIARVLGVSVSYDTNNAQNPRSPGQLLKHYAPRISVRLNAIDVVPGEALLAFGSIKFMGVRGAGAAADMPQESLRNLSESGDLYEAAANLFAMMRALDKPDHTAIAVMNIPESGVGIAINDRLRRAAAG